MPELYARTVGGTLVRLFVKDGEMFEVVAEPGLVAAVLGPPPAINHGKVPPHAEEAYLRSWATIRNYKVDLMATAEAEANRLGQMVGTEFANWVFDGNTPSEEYGRVLNGIEDGDPKVMDAFHEPTLDADGMDRLLDGLELPPGLSVDDSGRIGDAWDNGASEGFWHQLEKICREHVDGG